MPSDSITWKELTDAAKVDVCALSVSEGVCFALQRAYELGLIVPSTIVMEWTDYMDLYHELGISAQPGEWMAAEFYWVTPFGKVKIKLSQIDEFPNA